MRGTLQCLAVAMLLPSPTAAEGADGLSLRAVLVPVESYRLLAMSRDDEGALWTGSIHRKLHRYEPRTGDLETIPLPRDAVVCSCLCQRGRVYILGQSYPKLIAYDRGTKRFAEYSYPTANPDVWYGVAEPDERHLLLFDRNGGVIRWDTEAEAGTALPWPYPAPVPMGGRYESRDGAVWCQSFDFSGGQYVPLGLSKLDLTTGTFSGWFPYPTSGAVLEPYDNPEKTSFVPYTLKGKLIPFDFESGRWCRFLDVPGYGEQFGFIGLGTLHRDCWYFSLSTYDGDETGCDGQPHHFVNGLLEFDPEAKSFRLPTLAAKDVPGGPPDAYYQVAYTLSAGGEFYATGSNIRQPDGSLDGSKGGHIVFWQTRAPADE